VEASDHVNGVGFQPIIHGIRESTQESPAESCGNLRRGLRQVRDQVHDLLERLDEFVAEAWSLGVIPLPGKQHVRRRLRAEADYHS
jgi:hypothetical protein